MGSAAVYEIETPENVRFRVERAGLASRALAWVIDVAMMAGLLQVSSMLLAPLQWFSGNAASALILVASFLVQWWYSAVCEWKFAGRTCGKWLVGIATRDQTGLRITFLQSLVRNLLRIVDLLPGLYGVGALATLVDPQGRRLGDLAAGTVVVRERRLRLPAQRLLDLLLPDLRLYPELAEISQRLNPYEREAVLALAAQRDRLPLTVRIELFERLAQHLGQRFGFERPSHLSPEKVVLYVFAGLARGRTQES
ncbi:MAG: RDD family protein [Myxococcales bacterium]